MQRLLAIIAKLRAPDGCAWDKKQDKTSIARYLLEEVYELLDAIHDGSIAGEREELGDVLFLLLFLAQLAQERGEYQIDEVINEAQEKMRRRHPHIFGNVSVAGIKEIKSNWRAIKQKEKGALPLLASIPRSLPQLMRAQKAQVRAAEIGFDWDALDGIILKLNEEIAELNAALSKDNRARIEEEIGDILFSAVNISRFLGFDAETALRVSTEKFIDRFNKMETVIKESGRKIEELGAAELDRFWEEIKEGEG